VSSATIGSQDTEVTAGKITVESGSEPLYLVVSLGHPMFWIFQGEVKRLLSVVFIGGTPNGGPKAGSLAGEVGVPRDRITFLPSECMQAFYSNDNVRSSLAAGLLHDYVGRMPEVVAARENISEIRVPSGEIIATDPFSIWYRLKSDPISLLDFLGIGLEARIRPDLEKERISEYPDGLLQVDPATAVATASVSNYKILPDRADLEQLVKAGAIEDRGYGEYRIKEKIRLPARLSVATFLLLKGVSRPEGESGMACVVSEETGHVIMSPYDWGHC
jgi:hypothetical protein